MVAYAYAYALVLAVFAPASVWGTASEAAPYVERRMFAGAVESNEN